MADDRPLLHVTFGLSAAGSLRDALALLGRDERVIAEPDDLGYGPIEPHDPALRDQARLDFLGYDLDPEFAAAIAAFWTEVTTRPSPIVAWFSRRCVREHAGFLELLDRRAMPLAVVDVTESSTAFGYLRPEVIVERDLLGTRRSLSDVEVQRARAGWRRLKRENADLRVLDATGLVSAPITFFDELITSFVTDDWQKCARVVGESAGRAIGAAYYQTSDGLLWERLRVLIDDGVLEGRGDLADMRASWVRRRGP